MAPGASAVALRGDLCARVGDRGLVAGPVAASRQDGMGRTKDKSNRREERTKDEPHGWLLRAEGCKSDT